MVVSSYSTHSFYAFICIRYVHLIPIRYPFLYSDQDVNCSGNEFGSDGGFCVRGNANDIADECNNNGDCDNGECLVLSYVLDFIRILYGYSTRLLFSCLTFTTFTRYSPSPYSFSQTSSAITKDTADFASMAIVPMAEFVAN